MKETEIFQALSDKTRLRLMRLLITSGKELCCCELTDSLEEPQYNVSRHLKVLKQAGLVKERKEGRWVYSFASPPDDSFLKHLYEVISAIDDIAFSRDERNLQERLAIRIGGKCKLGIQKAHLAADRR